MRIALIGRNGQVGAELAGLLTTSHELVALDRAQLDLADIAAIRRMIAELQPQIVVNAAGYTAVDLAEGNPQTALAVNRAAPAAIAQELEKLGGALIQLSTDYVFDGRKGTPYTETDLPAPLNVYGSSMLAGEQAIMQSGCAHIIVRTSWVYGARGDNFCRMIGRLALTQNRLSVVTDQTGSPTAAITLAHVVTRLINETGTDIFGQRQMLHVAGRGAVSRYDLARHIVQALAQRFGAAAIKSQMPEPVGRECFPAAAIRPAYSALSVNKLGAEFGIELAPWQEDLTDFIASAPESVWR